VTSAGYTGVERLDREIFLFTTTGPRSPDVVVAHALDVSGTVVRRLGGSSG
jgi:hypothetical protein